MPHGWLKKWPCQLMLGPLTAPQPVRQTQVPIMLAWTAVSQLLHRPFLNLRLLSLTTCSKNSRSKGILIKNNRSHPALQGNHPEKENSWHPWPC